MRSQWGWLYLRRRRRYPGCSLGFVNAPITITVAKDTGCLASEGRLTPGFGPTVELVLLSWPPDAQ